MRCNPVRWLWGLVPLAMLGFVAFLALPRAIEADLATRANKSLADARMSWAAAAFNGRDAIVTGRTGDADQQRRAAAVVATVPGVRMVLDRTAVLELVKDYLWSASLRPQLVRLDGFVPSEIARKSVIGAARATFPGRRVDDRMKLARGAPAQERWLTGVGFALKQLSLLNNGGKAELEGLSLSLSGEAVSAASFKQVDAALSRGLPDRIRLKENGVIAPLVDPYTWAARRRGQQVELTGHVPSQRQRDQIVAAAKASFPGLAVVDLMGLGRGELPGWQSVVMMALARIGELKAGRAELVGAKLFVAGLAESEEAVERIAKSLRSGIPAGFRVDDKIEQDPEAKARVIAARRRAEDEARRIANARSLAEQDEQRRADARRLGQEEERRKAEASRLAQEAERRRTEAQRRAAAEAKRNEQAALAAAVRAEAERQQAQRRAVEVKAAARRQAEQQAQRTANARLEQERARAALEARRVQEAKRLQEARQVGAGIGSQAEAERRRIDEVRRLRHEREQRLSVVAKVCQSDLTSALRGGVIKFKWASAAIDRESQATLERIATIAGKCPQVMIEVGGHTDSEGIAARKQRLSIRRARSVADFLIEAGVSGSRLETRGYADSRPIATNETPEGRAQNRRIEFTVSGN